MAKIVLVRIPLVLYSQRTSTVAAGAVAEEIAPRTSPSASEAYQSPVKNAPTRNVNTATIKKAKSPSARRIVINCLPYFLKISYLSSPPYHKTDYPQSKQVKWQQRID